MHASNCFCGGSGYLNCSNCGGRGSISETEYISTERYNSSYGRYESYREPYTVYRSCSSCSGSGKRDCLGKNLQGSILEEQFGASKNSDTPISETAKKGNLTLNDAEINRTIQEFEESIKLHNKILENFHKHREEIIKIRNR